MWWPCVCELGNGAKQVQQREKRGGLCVAEGLPGRAAGRAGSVVAVLAAGIAGACGGALKTGDGAVEIAVAGAAADR